jgi:hypothetical protein
MRQIVVGVAAMVLSIGGVAFAEEAGALEIWSVDPLVKVFREARLDGNGPALAEVARGEHASLQVVVRSEAAIAGLRAEVAPLPLDGGTAVLKPRPVRFVGYVPVDRPMQTPPTNPLRKPPADFPDPLLEDKAIDVKAGQAQPIWITVKVPEDTSPGTYRGTLSVCCKIAGEDVSARQPLAIIVYQVAVRRCRLWVTNWFAMTSAGMEIHPKGDSPEYYALLRRYARNMADHRQNVALIPTLSLTTFEVGSDGKLEMDFSRFDRWVTIFVEEGVIGRIEGGHIARRRGGFTGPFVVRVRLVRDGKIVAKDVDPTSPEAHEFYGKFLPALTAHLREKGWLDCYMQHLGDEPIVTNASTYRAMARLVRKYAPELKILDACLTSRMPGAMDIWVPQLNLLHHDYEYLLERQRAGDEVWFYTCVLPQAPYANRFIEQKLLTTRLLHWINYRYGVTGYLHWGYNQGWGLDPFKNTTRPHIFPHYLPAGDICIVYPGKDSPLDSIRHEAMRDGIVDHELLSMLAERAPATAKRIAEKHVLRFDKYNTDVETFRASRREMLECLSKP